MCSSGVFERNSMDIEPAAVQALPYNASQRLRAD